MSVRITVLRRKLPPLSILASVLFISVLTTGCAASHTTVVKPSGPPVELQTASKTDLIASYNQLANAVTSVNLGVTMTLTAGSAYTGVIKQYHEVNGFILAQKPSDIRVIGQAPIVGTKIFDMVSDADTFDISIPSQHKFITGPTKLERPSAKPIENLRPQHLIGAIFWPPIAADAPVLVEQAGDGNRYYVLTAIQRTQGGGPEGSGTDWEIAQKVWIDRTDLSVARLQTYDPSGRIASDISFAGWDTFGAVHYPRQVGLSRPGNDYKLQIGITKATFNETITADRFQLTQPQGEELVKVGEDAAGVPPDTKPAEPKN
jgi:hypothetical protein